MPPLVTVLCAGCALAGTWLARQVAPAAEAAHAREQAECARLQAVADKYMAASLAATMIGRDYGEVQDQLARIVESGFVRRAVVLNAQRRVVALVGSVPPIRIGMEVPADLQQSARTLPLPTPPDVGGAIVILEDSATAGRAAITSAFGWLRWGLLALSAAAWAALVAQILAQRRRSDDRAAGA